MALTPAEVIVALLRRSNAVVSVVGARIVSEEIPQTVNKPYLSVMQIDRVHEHHMTAADGVAHARVQVDSYARTRAQVEDLADNVRLTLDGFTGEVTVGSKSLTIKTSRLISDNSDFVRDLTGSDTGTKRVSHDYEVWYPETVPTF